MKHSNVKYLMKLFETHCNIAEVNHFGGSVTAWPQNPFLSGTKTGPIIIIIMLKNNALIVEVGKTALTFSSRLIANPVQLRLNVKPPLCSHELTRAYHLFQ